MGEPNKSLWTRLKNRLSAIFGPGAQESPPPPSPPPEQAPASDEPVADAGPHFVPEVLGPDIQPESLPSPSVTPQVDSLPAHATQFAHPTEARHRVITIGFDWGTSCSKVVLRDPYGSDTAWAVDFGDLSTSDSPFLLPSQLWIDPATSEGFLQETPEAISLPDLKLLLMQGTVPSVSMPGWPDGVPAAAAAAVYLGLALRMVRQWFFRSLHEIFRQYPIEWQLNVGIPAAHFASSIDAAFLGTAHVAWWLSAQPGQITLDRAVDAFAHYEAGDLDTGISQYHLRVVPEVVGQIAGYARSTSRAPGLHMLVDVGAATLDVAVFNLSESEGEDRYVFWSTAVSPRGAYLLHRARIDYLCTLADEHPNVDASLWGLLEDLQQSCGPLFRVLERIEDYLPDLALPLKPEAGPDNEWEKACYQEIYREIDYVRECRNPNAPEFKKGVPIFLCGGGKGVAVYTRALREVNSNWLFYKKDVASFKIDYLPRPANLVADALLEEAFDRLSVAYGLSYPGDDLGEIKPPGDIPNFPDDGGTGGDGGSGPDRPYHEDTKDWT